MNVKSVEKKKSIVDPAITLGAEVMPGQTHTGE